MEKISYFGNSTEWLFRVENISVLLTSYLKESGHSVNQGFILILGVLLCWLIYLAYLNIYLKPVSEKKTFIIVGKYIAKDRSSDRVNSECYYLIIGDNKKIQVGKSTYWSKNAGDLVDVMEHRYLDKKGNVKKRTIYIFMKVKIKILIIQKTEELFFLVF